MYRLCARDEYESEGKANFVNGRDNPVRTSAEVPPAERAITGDAFTDPRKLSVKRSEACDECRWTNLLLPLLLKSSSV